MGLLESVSIRRATVDDVPGLQAVESQALASAHIIPVSGTDWAPYVDDQARFIYLAEDTAPFGFVCAGRPQDIDVLPATAGEIIGLYLHPDYQGHGMGRKLLVRGLSVLKRRGFETGFIWLRQDASRAKRVVASLGFAETGYERSTRAHGIVLEQGFEVDLESYF